MKCNICGKNWTPVYLNKRVLTKEEQGMMKSSDVVMHCNSSDCIEEKRLLDFSFLARNSFNIGQKDDDSGGVAVAV